jgi:tetratricopeptide (TPR) repeat protein
MAQKHLFYKTLYLGFILILFGVMSAPGVAAASRDRDSDTNMSTRTLRTMARIYMTYGNYEKAVPLAEHAHELSRQTPDESNEAALCMIDLATVYSGLGMLSKSARMFQEGIAMQKQALFDDHPYVAQSYRMLSEVQRRAGDLEQAEQSLAQAVSIMLNHCDIQSKEMSPFVLESAKLLAAKGDLEQAQTNYRMALDMIEENYGPAHLMTASVLESMAECCLVQHEYDLADTYISRALTIRQQLFGRQNMLLVDTWLTKARVCRARGEMERSEYYLSRVTASVEKSRNAVTLATVYEKVNRVRAEGVVAAAGLL